MGEKRNQVNVRLNDDESETLDQISKRLNYSKSEVVRMALNNKLEESVKRKVLMTSDDREIITRGIAELLNELNATNSEINRIGNNINQIAKSLHGERNKKVLKVTDRDVIEQEFIAMSQSFKEFEREVMELWQSHV